uniref:PUM-HD domain-containing protein n=1 Tax=Cavia porcellus TaxID=10141 RepID=A0A286Y2B9_CAVPO
MSDLQKLIQGKIKTIAFCYTQDGNEEQRKQAFEELQDDLVELSKAKYFRNIVKKFLMYGSEPPIAEIIRSFKGHVRTMLQPVEASAVVEHAFNDKATLEQRNMLTEELCGNTFQLYKSTEPSTLDKVLEILTPLVQKEAYSWIFFTYATPKLRSELIEAIREAVVVAMHCLWHGTPKDRKVIVKTMKTYIEQVANGRLRMSRSD